MFRKTITICSVLALLCGRSAAQQSDRLLSMLRHELDYNFAQLGKQSVKPYYMSYRAEDAYRVTISSSFGVTQSDDESHSRIVTPQIRLGDKQLDNFKYNTQGMPSQGRNAVAITIPFDDDAADGIAANIWNATLARYNTARQQYEQARSKAATSSADEDKAPCFSDAPVENYYEPALPSALLRVDRKAWEQKMNAVSAVFKAEPSLQVGLASLEFTATRTWLVNTEGTSIVQNRLTARVMLTAQAIADDGMQLPIMHDFFSFSIDSLPSQDSMIVVARDLLRRVVALKNAPVANPYTGPAILSGPASGVFFHEIFGHRLEGHRLKQGGETFKNMVGKPVLPEAFQVFSDPTLRQYHGQDMNGFYLYDSEGVKARRVGNVVDGVLWEFLMSRVPLDGFPQSNGHGRVAGANDPVSRQSNLCVETTAPMTDAQLRYELKKECKKQGKEYGYYFRTVTSGYTMTGEGGSINSFNVTPIEVYRVYVDGRPDELVRGVSLIGTPLSMFSHIKYGGGTPATFTGMCGAESGWVPVTANSPAIFVTQVETQRVQKSQAVPPVLPAPTTEETVSDNGKLFQKAMGDEMKRSIDSLHIQGVPSPFYVSYITNRYRSYDITGELGGITHSKVTPWLTSITAHVLLGNFKRCSDFMMRPMIMAAQAPGQPDYLAMRRAFWSLTDGAYKNAVNVMAQKENLLRQYPLLSALERIPDMQHSAPITFAGSKEPYNFGTEKMQDLAKKLSAVFKDYRHLYNTSVKISGTQMESYRTTSENVNLDMPHDKLVIQANATFDDGNHIRMNDVLTLSYRIPSELPSDDELKAIVSDFAENCEELRQAREMLEYYKGPVMYENEASMQVFTANYLVANQFYAAPNIQEAPKSLGQKLGKKIMDERITIRNLTAQEVWEGKPLFGHYSVDADGFKPQSEMIIVDKGVFKMMLNRTTPAQYAERSTGSARIGNDPMHSIPTVGVGTLAITAERALAQDKMEKALVKAAKKHKLNYAYVISCPANSTCLRLYQIDVKTGKRVLMKTNDMVLPTQDELKNLMEISAENVVKNFVMPYTYSVVYPKSIIVDDVELDKSSFKPSPAAPITYPLLRGDEIECK